MIFFASIFFGGVSLDFPYVCLGPNKGWGNSCHRWPWLSAWSWLFCVSLTYRPVKLFHRYLGDAKSHCSADFVPFPPVHLKSFVPAVPTLRLVVSVLNCPKCFISDLLCKEECLALKVVHVCSCLSVSFENFFQHVENAFVLSNSYSMYSTWLDTILSVIMALCGH